MLRLELEAEVANLQAEAEAMVAEAAVEGREPDLAEDAAAADAAVRSCRRCELDRRRPSRGHGRRRPSRRRRRRADAGRDRRPPPAPSTDAASAGEGPPA